MGSWPWLACAYIVGVVHGVLLVQYVTNKINSRRRARGQNLNMDRYFRGVQ